MSGFTNTAEALRVLEPVMHVLETLRRYRFNTTTEAEFQAGVERALKSDARMFEREVRLTAKDRIDFLAAGGVGIELKIGGANAAVERQLLRYAQHERIASLVVCTTRAYHMQLPQELNGKLVFVHLQGGV